MGPFGQGGCRGEREGGGRDTHEETRTDGATDSNHLQVTGLHLLLEERIVMGDKLGGNVTMSHETTVGR